MSIFTALALVAGGLFLLAWGGDVLVRNATRIAVHAGLTPAVIGLTIVAMGTSLPELVVSFAASVNGKADIAVANVIGSNIVNITATLGVTALVTVLPVRTKLVTLEWPVLFVATLLALVFMRDLRLDRLEGAVFVMTFVVFTSYCIHVARREVTDAEKSALSQEVDALAKAARPRVGPAVVFLLLALALLVVGGELLVRGAVELARQGGLSERVIGLTIVAVGTGAPEIATSIMAAMRKETAIAVANLVGSSIFNLLGILGITSLVHPLTFSPEVFATDSWWMLGSTVLLLLVMLNGRRILRWEGVLLLGVYVVYVIQLL